MAVTFKPRVTWKERVNELMCPYEWSGIQKPAGLGSEQVREPKFVSDTEIGALVRGGSARNTPRGLATVHGLVSNDFKVRFPDPVGQWRALPNPDGRPPARGPVNFQFQGGDVILDLTLGLYILDSVKPGDDDKSKKIYNIHYEHELLHVMDEIDIVTMWLAGQAPSDPTVARYFVRAESYTYGLQSQTAAEARTDFIGFIGQPLYNVWAAEANRRQGIRDAQSEYDKISNEISKIQYGNSAR